MKKNILFILFILMLSPAFAQQRLADFLVYGKESGLTQSSYHDVFESSDGYWWLGSSNGLFRFDGKRFRQIISWYADPNSPADNNIVDIEEDRNGNLWLAGFTSGLSKYNLRTGKFTQYRQLGADSAALRGSFCFTLDSENNLWVGTAGLGLAMYDAGKDNFIVYPVPQNNPLSKSGNHLQVTGICEDEADKNILWISSFDGLYQFNKKTKTFFFIDADYPLQENGAPLKTFLCMEQSPGSLFMGTWFAGLVRYDKQTNSFHRIAKLVDGKPAYNYGTLDIQLYADSLLYLACMNQGLLSYNINSQIISEKLTQKDVPQLNAQINIQRVSIAGSSGFFAGGNAAVYQLPVQGNRFGNNYFYQVPEIYPGQENHFTAVQYDAIRNCYWATCSNFAGVIAYNEDFYLLKLYPSSNKKQIFEELALDKKGRPWVIDRQKKLLYLETVSGKFISADSIQTKSNQQLGNGYHEIEADVKGNLWFAGKNKVLYLDVSTDDSYEFELPKHEIINQSAKGIEFLSLRTDEQCNAWMATNIGLIHFDPASRQVNYYHASKQKDFPLASNSIKSISIDKENNIWLGYFNEGIQVFNSATGKLIQSFGTKEGLPSVEINYLATDTMNNMYACLHNGLAIYNTANNNWQIIDVLNGLDRDYLDRPVFSFSNGKMLLSQNNSFIVFSTKDIISKNDNNFLHLTSVKVNGKEWEGGVLPEHLLEINAGPDVHDIQIEFSVFNHLLPLRSKYYYRVDGIHSKGEWIASEEARITLTGLAAGKYSFRFYAITATGSKTAEKVLLINIRPYFYQTWWFLLCCILIAAGILYGIFRYRINQLKKLHAMRNNISRNLHDDIGSSLSNISILTELARRNAADKEKLLEYLKKAGDDIKQTSENLGDIVWNIHPDHDDLQTLLTRMRRYAADMMEGKNIDCEINFPGESIDIKTDLDKRRHLFLIYKESINNLIKYSGASKATITIRLDKNEIHLQISDNGKGFDSDLIYDGNGLVNMKYRAGLCGGKILIKSVKGEGTLIDFRMPV